MFSYRGILPCLLCCGLAAAGCSDPFGGRQEVIGCVILDGTPLDDGSITFYPLDGQDTQSGAPIVNGGFVVPRPSGLKPGKYLIRLTAGDGKTPTSSEAGPLGGSSNSAFGDRIPEEWNTKSIRQVEVKAIGRNKFDFDIPNAIVPESR